MQFASVVEYHEGHRSSYPPPSMSSTPSCRVAIPEIPAGLGGLSFLTMDNRICEWHHTPNSRP